MNFQKKSQGKSVEFVLTHQYKSLEHIPTESIKRGESTTELKASTSKPSKSCINNRNDSHDSYQKECASNQKNITSSLKKKAKEHHLLTCNKSTSLTGANTQHHIASNLNKKNHSKCDQCGHSRCYNTVNNRDSLPTNLVDTKRLCRNNSCSSDRGIRYRSHSASSTTRSLENNESISTASLDSNYMGCFGSIKDRIAYAQIFLEAFGNACTQQNNNSSRFVS